MLKSIDLFSGAGGFSEGLGRVGISSVIATDWDEMAAKTFKFNHPLVPFITRDLSEVSSAELLQASGCAKGEIDIIAGGPPCQGFSIAGRRVADDPRNQMFKQFVRIVKEIEPRVFVFENVRGITSMQGGQVLKAILQEFTSLGYSCQWKTLDASDYGVPQARPRFILVGTSPETNFTFPTATHSFLDSEEDFFEEKLIRKITVWDAISDLPNLLQGEGSEELLHSGDYHNEFQRDRRGKRTPGSIFNHRATSHSELVQERYRLIPEGKNNVTLPEHLRTKKTNVYKLDRSRPARTVTCNHRTDLLHPIFPRGTTVREAARLQSFDDDYRFFGNLTRKAAWVTQDDQVGNAVPPLLAEAIGRQLIESLSDSEVTRNGC
jgi:DNA (cytosine-5)-methyltransferase 1